MLFNQEDTFHLQSALETLETGFSDLPATAAETEQVAAILQEVAERLWDNYPYFHPLYAGQMLKPPATVARLAYALAMTLNPNNHALDGGRASSTLEKEAVAEIAAMFGWQEYLGHLCGGGTMANMEALWVARELASGQTIVASTQAHYTHARLSAVLNAPFEAVPCERNGRMDCDALEERLKTGTVGTVVATIGTTATGAVDPLPRLLDLRAKYGFRLHADAAYGGYFVLAGSLSEGTRAVYDRLGEVDSLVIDPHKHGLQPYGCGCVLFRDPSVGRFYKHDSPYTYFSSAELHLGEISLECSRPGAAAVALWATQRMFPLMRSGEFASRLDRSLSAARELHRRLREDPRYVVGFLPELDIVIWAPRAGSISEASLKSRLIFEEAARRHLHLALAELPTAFFDMSCMDQDRPTILCLRSVLMKPEHRDWIDEIWGILSAAYEILN